MTDFYARLEGQLAEAARRRGGAGRRHAPAGRGRPLLAIGAVVLAVAAGAALVPVLRSSLSHDGGQGAASPAAPKALPTHADRPPTVGPLRGVRIGVLNATGQPGQARTVAEMLAARGAVIRSVGNAADQSLERTRVAYRDRFEDQARDIARLLGARSIAPATSEDRLLAPGTDVVVHVGRDRCFVGARCEPRTPGVP
jgi:hypothetical protein